ncbi:unconventional myosin-VIIb-like [Scomber scombrus]|uniref:Unconventional myosin-VIIb-like n=1 Tax=Scomber scombrus TaxID=13677 RepID=A0AAV1N0C8_SCOSC
MLRKGEWVWLDSGIGVPIGARVKVTSSGKRLLVDDEGKEQKLSKEQEASLKIMHPTSVEGVDDMIKLGDMNEAGLLRNLLIRHKKGLIYTYTGSVLVAVNPYQDYPLYSADTVKLYHGRKLGELPPHIFAISEACYFNMKRHLRNQCCIISGESGAGKTESTKLILQYFAAVSGVLSEHHVEKQILESNPILEAFGNAKTVRNDNSSRFGKYLEIFFNKDGVIEGARVEQYLLEKSRVCHQAPEERNYHIFYCMLAGISAEEKKNLRLKDSKDYKFLTKGDCIRCDGREDAKDYRHILSAMKILTFSESQCQEILKLLAAILHLGNVCFEAKTENNLETSDVSKSENFPTAASLLDVKKSSLATSLTHRSFMTNKERVVKPLSCEQAADCRDALVKAIYNKLFIWIVEKINQVIYKKLAKSPKFSFLSIGLLDIFGFENFLTNSFEQLCINFANEKLQQFFVGHIFKLEQKEYMKEDIEWSNLKFSDNQDILDVLAGKPCNLLALIDEESQFPKGTDVTLLSKMNKQHRGNKIYVASKSEYETDFGIRHYAGEVHYDSTGFLEKNRDAVSGDIIKMVEMSKSKLLRQIFENELSTNAVKVANNKKIIMTPKSSLRVPADKRKQVQTLSGQFRQSLDSLMKTLSLCQPYFIRCFKPNNDKQSQVFDRELCMRQLRYSGMMDTIRIRNLGYPIRHTFAEFLKRYRVLLKTTVCDPKTESAAVCCEAICNAVIEGENEWKIGRTKIFLKDAHDALLERLREQELSRVAVVIQRVMLGYKDRKSFLKKRSAAVVMQKNWRAYKEKKIRIKHLRGFHRLVSKIRGRKLQLQYKRQQEAALTLQTQVRGYQARTDWKKKREAVILLQACTRGHLARKETDKMKNDPITLGFHICNLPNLLHFIHNYHTGWQSQYIFIFTFKMRQETPDSMEEISRENSEPESEISTPPRKLAPAPKAAPAPTPKAAPAPSPKAAPAPAPASPTPSQEEEDDDEFDDGSEEFSFHRFSILHFQGNATHTHINQRLKEPLLNHDDEGDILASVSCWWIILRYMEDIPEPKSMDSVSMASSTVSSRNMTHSRGRRLSNLVGLDQKILRKNKKKAGGTNRRASAIPEESENLTEDEDVQIGEGATLDRTFSSTDKLHIIIGYALSRRGMRDEIYCQICKQLVNNRNRKSRMLGWALLSICLGIFPPTDLFMKYLERFVRKGPNGYGEYCSKRLRRIVANGERNELPSWKEIQVAKTKEPIDVSLTLMDDRTITLPLDSASTSAEVCQAVADNINLRDTYGFSLYISLYEKMWSLGSDEKHVFDAVSQCEQEMRRQGKLEKNAPWKLSIRKEKFTPWHDCSVDPISTDLIYRQVIKGIKQGEYISEKDHDYVQLAAKHYYVTFGAAYSKDNVQKVVEECITTTLIEKKSMAKWIQLISSEHLQGPYISGTISKGTIEGEVVDTAQEKWSLDFSRFYEVTMTSGPPLPKSRFIVAVNSSGIFFMDGRDRRLVELPYVEVKEVQTVGHSTDHSVSLATVRGQFVLMCGEAVDMALNIEKNLIGLRERSQFALVQQDNKTDDAMFVPCKRGDLLVLHRDRDYSRETWIKATNQRTMNSGAVYKDTLQFLPTLNRPTDEILDLLSPGHRKTPTAQIATQRDESVAPVSLKEFALENFRPPGKEVGRQGVSKGAGREKLWASSKEPLKQPLMKYLLRNSDLSSLACNAFTDIL